MIKYGLNYVRTTICLDNLDKVKKVTAV
jgi:hypothetical protein